MEEKKQSKLCTHRTTKRYSLTDFPFVSICVAFEQFRRSAYVRRPIVRANNNHHHHTTCILYDFLVFRQLYLVWRLKSICLACGVRAHDMSESTTTTKLLCAFVVIAVSAFRASSRNLFANRSPLSVNMPVQIFS